MPLIGSHLLKRSNNEDTDEDGQLSMQSCFPHMPIKCVFGKESMKFLQEQLGPIFNFFMGLSMSSVVGQNELFLEWQPFIVGCPAIKFNVKTSELEFSKLSRAMYDD